MSAPRRTIRLFVSSTFSDMKAERDLLQREVFPQLRQRCLAQGFRFQALDLRWGISDEAGRGNRTMRICLRELRRCQAGGPKPNFLILLGDRYGWRPLPELIPAELCEQLEKGLTAEMAERLHRWYQRDDNAVPPVYVLQPRQPPFADSNVWSEQVETPLLAALQGAAQSAGLEAEAAFLHLGLSATHQEILHGALNLPAGEVRQHVHAFTRSIRLPAGATPHSDFTDLLADGKPDAAAQEQLARLRSAIAAHITVDNVHGYSVDWRDGGEFAEGALRQFRDDVLQALESVIAKQVESWQRIPGDHEETAHRAFAAERREGFVGREAELGRVADYLAGADTRPLFVLGPAGSGKSAFIARAAAGAREALPAALIIERYIGATSAASRVVPVLQGLVQRIRTDYPAGTVRGEDGKPKSEVEIANEYNPLVADFHASLKRATPAKPLILFIDALDQFSGTDLDTLASWLPTSLPGSVRLVVSSALPPALGDSGKSPQARVHALLTARFPGETQVALPPLRLDHGGLMLSRWLAAAGRTLQPEQRAAVLRTFDAEGSPLWLRTAAEELSRLGSWMPPPELPSTTAGLIRRLIGRLSGENEHGAVLVERALGYLACSRQGLSEDEILDLLSEDGEVMDGFRRRFPQSPPVQTLPVAVWVPLLGDIAPFLSESEAHGASLLRFYHRVLLETVELNTLSEVGARQRIQQMMATYFTRQARGTNEVGAWESCHARGFAECVYHQANAELWADVEQTLSDFGFLMQKTRLGLLEGLFDDCALVDAAAPPDTCPEFKVVKVFFRETAHLLRRGSANWPAYKILLQLAVEHADDSPLTLGAERWMVEKRDEWAWLRRHQRPARVPLSPGLVVLAGHSNIVLGATELPGGEILSWSYDKSLRLWNHQSGKCLAVLEGHSGGVNGAMALPAGRILSWSKDHSLRIWEIQSEKCLAVLTGHSNSVDGALILPDSRILSWSEDSTLRVWESQSGKPLKVLRGHASKVNGAISLLDDRILSWSGAGLGSVDNIIRLWESKSGIPLAVLKGHSDLVHGAMGLPDGRILSWSEDNTLRLWNGQSGENLGVLQGHLFGVLGALVVPDGRILSWARDYTLRLWDGRSGRVLQILEGHAHWVTGARVLPGGRILSWSLDHTLRLWDNQSGKCRLVLVGHTDAIGGALVLTDGRILSWAEDRTLRLWNSGSGKCLAVLVGHSVQVRGAVSLPEGQILSWSLEPTLRVWDSQSEKGLAGLESYSGWIKDVIVLPDSRVLSWSSENSLRLWDSQSGKCLAVLEGHTRGIKSALILPDGRILSCSEDKTLRIWDNLSGKCLGVLSGHSGEATGALVLAEDRILSWSFDKTLRIWDSHSQKCLTVLTGHTGSVRGALQLADGRILSWSWDNTLRFWDGASAKCLAVLEGHPRAVDRARVLPDGRILSWSGDNSIRLWDSKSGRFLAVLEGHSNWLQGVLMMPDGRILSWAWDNTLRLWNGQSGRCLGVLEGHQSAVSGAMVLADGRIVSWAADSVLRIWDNSGRPVGIHSVDEGFRLFPAFREAYSGKDNLQPPCLWCSGANTGIMRFFEESPGHDLLWHSDSGCIVRHLFPDGRAILTQSTGQLCCLQLHQGNRPISIAELERINLENASHGDPRKAAIDLEKLAAKGRDALADELSKKTLSAPGEGAKLHPRAFQGVSAPKDLPLAELLAAAEGSFGKGNFDTAMTMYGKASDHGAPATAIAPKWVACLLGVYGGARIPDQAMTRAKAILEKLESEGGKSLAADLDRTIRSHQQSVLSAAEPKRPWWKRW